MHLDGQFLYGHSSTSFPVETPFYGESLGFSSYGGGQSPSFNNCYYLECADRGQWPMVDVPSEWFAVAAKTTNFQPAR